MGPLRALVIGAGSRGSAYSEYALENPDKLRIVGVAEPRAEYRDRFVRAHSLEDDSVFVDWRDPLVRQRFADIVFVTTQDKMHAEPAIAYAEKGYNILLEKPMAPTEKECIQIVDAVKRSGVTLAVCHILRYTKHTRRLKEIISSGAIGTVVSIQHFEPVGYWHQAHSFVRGNWGNEAKSSPLLLAKSCHDLDWLQYIMGESCTSVSSFGGLHHFTAENHPDGGGERCTDCAVEADCPYSALKLYMPLVNEGKTGWPVDILTPDVTEENVLEALRTGPYGRCAYLCDNDVVDNQVVALAYEGNRSATFTVNAFNNVGGRKTRIFGTRGELYLNEGDREPEGEATIVTPPLLRHFDFLTERISYEVLDDHVETALTGHHFGDFHLVDDVITGLREQRPELIVSGPDETLASHRTVFAAETSRRECRVVHM
ncbi:MAG: Gfo/Idh/MocA family oxidoreductase [Rhodothermales bacterium]|nr:Gfo/Idh/MocA family oxidoreductase [Rhodothermales bacterium]